MRDRIMLLLTNLKIKPAEFCVKTGIPKSRFSDLVNGKTANLSAEAIIKIRTIYNVNSNWLLTGEGGMFLGDVDNADNTVEVTFDENGYPITKIYQPSESKKSKTKSADVVSLEGLSDSEKEHVINTVKLFLAGKGKK